MCTRLSWVLGTWIFAAVPVLAQTPPPAGPLTFPDGFRPVAAAQSALPTSPAIMEGTANPVAPPPVPDTFRFWVRAEYLSYWVKNAPLPVSLLTGDPNNPTQELLNSDRNFGMFSGYRIGFGMWLDPCNNLGLEASFFGLQRRAKGFSASSDPTGNPILAFPYISQTPGAEGNASWFVTSPGQFAGNVWVGSTLQLSGTELNAALSMVSTGQLEVVGLLGFRYVNLHETLCIDTNSNIITTNPVTMLFQSDQFRTRNQFYGGQIGARLNWQGELFALDVTGKVAIGGTHQSVDVNGYSIQSGPGGVNGTFPGGFFTQPSNMGHYSANQFAVIPSVEMKLWVHFTSRLRGFVGYDFMYWNQVVRPGSQIDRNINLTQTGTLFSNGGPNGPLFPSPLLNRTDFWAQGITLGLELRF